MTPGSNSSHLVTVIFLAFWWIPQLCIKGVKAVSTSLVYIMIGGVQKGTKLTRCLPLYSNIWTDLIAGPEEDEKRHFAER